jgi:hypothetical protein
MIKYSTNRMIIGTRFKFDLLKLKNKIKNKFIIQYKNSHFIKLIDQRVRNQIQRLILGDCNIHNELERIA